MKGRSLLETRVRRGAARVVAASLPIAVSGALSGCLTRPIQPIDPVTSSTAVERLAQSTVTQIDLVLMVDNSASMADKQEILSRAIPDLILGLVKPKCLDAKGQPVAAQPQGVLGACPLGSQREFTPVADIHVGVLSSSLGTFGANGCSDATPSKNDHGHLVTRVDPAAAGNVATYQNKGFLAWDPAQKLLPPGEASESGLEKSLHDLVLGDGQAGCGFESQNESWYRFLVDPAPYASITFGGDKTIKGGKVQTSGVDELLLQQRRDFLRPTSLLAIINVTDETDTSIKAESFYPVLAEEVNGQGQYQYLPHARSECTTKGPADRCCSSCGLPAPAGCPADPACASNEWYDAHDENLDLRAFGLISHKARYGVEFFYPPSRYVQALTSTTVPDRQGHLVANPLYSVLDPSNTDPSVRSPHRVFYAAITGVPWQLIARQKADGTPDLLEGKSSLDPTAIGGFKSAKELGVKDAKGNTVWDYIAGDPENYVPAKSPFMQESTRPRTGTDPITGVTLSPPSSPNGANPINGHERTIALPAGDIEYACTFPILSPIDCSQPGGSCDCYGPENADNPLCEPNPNDVDPATHMPRRTLQVRAKAYPGIKNLAIAKGMGDQGIAASICARQVDDPTKDDYGYRPAVRAIIDRLKLAIAGQCLPRKLTPDAAGQVECLILEARAGSGACDCSGAARRPVTAEHQPAVQGARDVEPSVANDCFCEVVQTQGDDLKACQTDLDPNPVLASHPVDGWCYVEPPTGNPALVHLCSETEKRQIRFVGAGKGTDKTTTFITCAGG